MLPKLQYLVFTIAITIVSRIAIAVSRYLPLKRIHVPKRGSREEPIRFMSGGNQIDANLVQPLSETRGAVLICHGIGETVWVWDNAQRLLAQNGVASLMFNYSGWGKSTGFVDARQCEADALAAYRLLEERLPGVRLSLLGFSLGTGVVSSIASRVQPHRLFLCSSYTTLRKAAGSMGFPWPLPLLLPPIWDNLAAMKRCAVPTVIVHGEKDGLFRPRMAQALAAACAAPCELILVPETTHARPIFAPELTYWKHVIDRV